MLWNLRRVFFKTGGDDGGASGGDGSGADDKRKAHSAVVDQVHSIDDRVKRLEGGFFDRIAAALTPKPAPTPATPEVKTATGEAPKRKTVADELGECMDPFGLFEEPTPPVKPEAPSSDEATA